MNLVGLVETASSLKEQKIDPMQTSFDGRVGVKAPLPQDHPLRDKVSTEFRDRETSRVENGGTKPVEIQIELVDILREDKGDGE
mmetsp:Transcript_9376/g.18706  ORF Transcript_9376/g.18706 Transcript_9376/m.18706 type:complete len:84 (+) Transcript_9376:1-252(+)